MAKFRIDSIAELSRQLSFTPHETRLAQVTAAEELLSELDEAKAYPLDFIIFRVTGYHPKVDQKIDQTLLTGLALQHDLGLLIERVSITLSLQAAAMPQPVLSIDEVTERFNVTSKTIQRWRRRGLAARRFVFPDGKSRVGFMLNSVERFFSAHRDQVARAANFTLVTEAEQAQIVRRAARLAVHCRCCTQQITNRIGRRLNRSPLTILHVIKKHDLEHPDQAIFPQAAHPISEDERTQIVKGYRRGLSVKQVAQKLCRPRTAVYRVIMDERLARLNKRKVRYIDDPLYHQPDAAAVIAEIVSQQDVMEPRRAEESRIPRDLPPYLQDLYRTPLLSPAKERALFLDFNYRKQQFIVARRRIEPQALRWRDLALLERLRRNFIETKNAIVRANLRLVVSTARKHLRPGLSLMELISDGNMTLMRAVEGFDFHKGNRFSTYATFALMKGFARSVPQMLSANRDAIRSDALLAGVADFREVRTTDRMLHREHVQHLLSRLDQHERAVLFSHYGLGDDVPATYEQVGRKLGLSKRRVRQIEQTALAKLRKS